MGLVYADITQTNGTDVDLAQMGRMTTDRVREMTVSALVDFGTYNDWRVDQGSTWF